MTNNSSHSSDKTLADGFVESCSLFPANSAIHIQGVNYSYAELLEKAKIIFSKLGDSPCPSFVGIYCEESVWTYAAIIAVSLSGACYVPLNPKLPEQKLQTIISECKLQLVISENKIPFSHGASEINIDKTNSQKRNFEILVNQPYAYLLFTSGTTGNPKGVPVTKQNAKSFFDYFKINFDFKASDKFLQPYELSFDVSVFSMFAAWNCGACVFVVPDKGFRYFNIINTIKEHSITVSSMVPTVLVYIEKYLNEFSFSSLRYSFFSGDKLYQHLAVKWKKAAPNAHIYNCYGPTETTIVCTGYPWEEKQAEKESVNNIVPLGKPFSGMEYILVDETNSVVQQGKGELCFAGQQVIPAYLNTSHENCFFTNNGKRYYKTGDLAEVNKNGNLVFHGRTDSQLKINGFRVELIEIENIISGIAKKNVAVISTEKNNLNLLVAFIEADMVDTAKLKEELIIVLPEYMMPESIETLAIFPKNINDKIDRHRLKEIYNERNVTR
jgi:D-alanine--poly(phosphoribitol) ligase subunit 1